MQNKFQHNKFVIAHKNDHSDSNYFNGIISSLAYAKI